MKFKQFTWNQLLKMDVNKSRLAEILGLPCTGVDYALPQQWLDRFAQETGLPYHKIRYATFMVYNFELGIYGQIISAWKEVNHAIERGKI